MSTRLIAVVLDLPLDGGHLRDESPHLRDDEPGCRIEAEKGARHGTLRGEDRSNHEAGQGAADASGYRARRRGRTLALQHAMSSGSAGEMLTNGEGHNHLQE